MRDATARLKKYDNKLIGDIHKLRADLDGSTRKANYRQAAGDQVAIERLVKQVLTQAGTFAGLNHFYMNFGKKIARDKAMYGGGNTLYTEVCAERTHWVSRGLDIAVLDSIISRLGLQPCPVPAPPGPWTYDYSSGVGVDRWAYTWTSAVGGLRPDPPPYGVEFTPLQYTFVSASDDAWVATAPANVRASNLFKIQIPIPGPAVTKIDWLMEGHVWGSGVLTIHGGYIWNFTTTTWDLLFEVVNEFADVTHSGSIVAGMANYVDGTGTMYFAHFSRGVFPATTCILYTDYVRFVIHD